MTEKEETTETSEFLFARIWQRLIQVIPYLLLSSGIAFLIFQFLSSSLGSNFFRAIAVGVIVIVGLASLISITIGRISKNRQLGSTLAFLTPIAVSMEATIQYGLPFGELLVATYFSLCLGLFVYIFTYNMLSSLVSTEGIKEENVTSIQLYSSIAEVTRLIGEVFRFLNISKIKKIETNNEIQWRIIPRESSNLYYLYAKAENDKSVKLAFLGFTEGYNELIRSKRTAKYQDFLKETILGYFRVNDIGCNSLSKADLSGDILKIVRKSYEGMHFVELKSTKSVIINYIKSYKYLIISIFFIAILIYFGRLSISKLYEMYPGIFLAIVTILSGLIGAFAKDLLRFFKVGGKNGK